MTHKLRKEALSAPKRHIKIRGKYNQATGTVTLTVLERTHSDYSFGRTDGEHAWHFGSRGFVHKSIRIYHDVDYSPRFLSPSFEENSNVTEWFLVGLINSPIEVTLKQWNRVKEAVEAYNRWGEEAACH